MRPVIFILNVIEEIYTHWVKPYEERFILSISCFSWVSRISIHSFLYFSTIKRTPWFIAKKKVFHPFLDLSENEINRHGTTSESYSVLHCHKEFRWFSSWIIDVPSKIRLTTRTITSNGNTEIKTDFVSNINGTMLFAITHSQIDGLYCVRFWDIHNWALRNLNESFSDYMQIFLVPLNGWSRNWNGFVIVKSFYVSTAHPNIHPNSNPHPQMNHP